MFDDHCAYCGNPLGKLWHVDHRVPVRRTWKDDMVKLLGHTRGGNDEENWFPACTRCNQRKGTLSVEEFSDHIRFGEFYLFPDYQGRGIGSWLLQSVLNRADVLSLPVRLEYLKWNPVGSLYLRHGFEIVSHNDTHFFMVRSPNAA